MRRCSVILMGRTTTSIRTRAMYFRLSFGRFMRLKSRAETTLWFGRGFPIRELLHVDDLPGALVFCIFTTTSTSTCTSGAAPDRRPGPLLGEAVEFGGRVTFDPQKADGTLPKLGLGQLVASPA